MDPSRRWMALPALLALAPAGLAAQSLTWLNQPTGGRVGHPLSPVPVVQLLDGAGAPIPGRAVTVTLSSGPAGAEMLPGSAGIQTDADGLAFFDDLRMDGVGVYRLVATASTGQFTANSVSNAFPVAGTNSIGPLTTAVFALAIPDGACPHPNPAFPTCFDGGDLLPPGQSFLYQTGVFDSGSRFLVVDNRTQAFSSSDVFDLCAPNTAFCASNADANIPPLLETHLWGRAATADDTSTDNPVSLPAQAVTAGARVRAEPIAVNLLGAPVTARAVALIDYTTAVERTFSWGLRVASPDIQFFNVGDADIPAVPFRISMPDDAVAIGPGTTTPSHTGPIFFLEGIQIENGTSTVSDGPTRRYELDTGNTITQISEAVAQDLGLDLANPVAMLSTNTPAGTVPLSGFVIDQLEITAEDGISKYLIDDPVVYVRPAPPAGVDATFGGGGVHVLLGTNFFDHGSVLWDGPAGGLGIPRSIELLEPTTQQPAYAGSAQSGRRVLVRLALDLPGLPVDQLEVVIDGSPAPVVTAGVIDDEYWLVLDAPASADGCYDLAVGHPLDAAVQTTMPQAVCYETDRLFDRVLAIDRTTSMLFNSVNGDQTGEKMEAARAAGRFFVDLSSDADQVGVTSFKRWTTDNDGVIQQDEIARTDFPLALAQDGATDNREAARDAVTALAPDGGGFPQETSIGGGLQEAWDALQDDGDTDHEWEIALLSDGRENLAPFWEDAGGPDGPLAPRITTADPPVRVHTVALGEDAEFEVLEDIAAETGGRFWSLYEGTASYGLLSRLASVYKEIDESIRGEQRFFYNEGLSPPRILLPNRRMEAYADTIPVEAGLSSMSVGLHANLPGAVRTWLYDPQGNDAATLPGVELRGDPHHAVYRIPDPVPGNWVYLVQTFEEEGLEFFATASGDSDLVARLGPLEVREVEPDFYEVPVRVVVADSEPIVGATVVADVRRPDGVHDTVELLDDGRSGDGAPGDGIYGATIREQMPGPHGVAITATGTSSQGTAFARLMSFSFYVPGFEPPNGGLEPPLPDDSGSGGRVRWAFSVGSAHPLGTLDDPHDANVHVALDVTYPLTPRLDAVVIAGISQLTAEPTSPSSHLRWAHLSLNGALRLPGAGPLVTYMRGGPGLYRPKNGADSFGFNVGVTGRVPLPGGLGAELGGDLHRLVTKGKGTFVTFRVGLTLR